MTVLAGLRTHAVVLACAISAGIHGALAPDHFDEGAGAGVGFVGAAVVLAALAVALSRVPSSSFLLATAAVVFAGLLGSYALAVTTGVPLLHPHPEPIDGLALVTKAVEAAGVFAIATLSWRPLAAVRIPQRKGTLQ